MTKIVCVGTNPGPERAFETFARHEKDSGHEIRLIVGDHPSIGALEQAASWADVALIGMSSERDAMTELNMAKLMPRRGKKYALFADTFGAENRAWFAPVRENAAGIIVVAENEVMPAQKLFPNAKIIAAGNPLWYSYLHSGSREEALDLLNNTGEDTIILVAGTKPASINFGMLAATLEAAQRLGERGIHIFVVYGPHPKDEGAADMYESMRSLAPNVSFRILEPTISTGSVLAGVDAVVHPGNSSIGLQTLLSFGRSIPVIDPTFVPLMDGYIRQETGGWDYSLGSGGATLRPVSFLEFEEWLSMIYQAVRNKNPSLFARNKFTLPGTNASDCTNNHGLELQGAGRRASDAGPFYIYVSPAS